MIGIVVVGHGGLARELLATTELIVGRMPGTIAIGVDADADCDLKLDEIDAAIGAADVGYGVAVVVDLFGGTPSNLAMEACREPGRIVVYSASVPLLLKLAKVRHLPLREAVACGLTAARKYINSADGSGPDRLPIAL